MLVKILLFLATYVPMGLGFLIGMTAGVIGAGYGLGVLMADFLARTIDNEDGINQLHFRSGMKIGLVCLVMMSLGVGLITLGCYIGARWYFPLIH